MSDGHRDSSHMRFSFNWCNSCAIYFIPDSCCNTADDVPSVWTLVDRVILGLISSYDALPTVLHCTVQYRT